MPTKLTVATADASLSFRLNPLLSNRPEVRCVGTSRRERRPPGGQYIALHGLHLALGLISDGPKWQYVEGAWVVMDSKAEALAQAGTYAQVSLGDTRGGSGIAKNASFAAADLATVEASLTVPNMCIVDDLYPLGLVVEARPDWERPGEIDSQEYLVLPLAEALTPDSFRGLGRLLGIDVSGVTR